MTAEEVFDVALAHTSLPAREGRALDSLATEWAPNAAMASAVAVAVRMARRGDVAACLLALQEAERLRHAERPACGCVACGDQSAWHGELCPRCKSEGWAEVACPTCGSYHLQRPDGYVLGGCRWARDQNDELPETHEWDVADEADMRQQELLDWRDR